MSLRLIFLVFLVSIGMDCFPQNNPIDINLPKLIPQSPTAAAFSRYGEIPISHTTGVPSIEIPLYNLVSGSIQLPLKLNYHSSGIKVNDMPTTVGLGWLLNTGGIITRTTISRPDGYLPKSIYSSASVINALKSAVTNINDYSDLGATLTTQMDTKDWQSDRFDYQLPNGSSGSFRYDFVTDELVILPKKPIKIFRYGGISGTAINGFIITDENGVQYHFDKTIVTASSQGNGANAWLITKIESADGVDNISYSYGPETNKCVKTFTGKSLSWGYVIPYINSNGSCNNDYNANNCLPNISTTNSIVTFYEPLLKSISANNVLININYMSESVGCPQFSVASIDIKKPENNEIFKKIKMQTGYFKNGLGNPIKLKLESVTISDVNEVIREKYNITYNSLYVADYNSGQDYWGYPNGSSENLIPDIVADITTSCTGENYQHYSNKRPNGFAGSEGLIKSIEWPTGGKTEFNFEKNYRIIQNTYPGGNNVQEFGPGYRIHSISSYTTLNTSLPFETKRYQYPNAIFDYVDHSKFYYTKRIFQNLDYVNANSKIEATFTNFFASSDPISSLTVGNGSHVFYPSVTEILENSSTILGKNEFHYLPPRNNFIGEELAYTSAFHEDYGNYSPTLEKQIVYKFLNNAYVPIKKTENTYTTITGNEYNTGLHVFRGTIYNFSYSGGLIPYPYIDDAPFTTSDCCSICCFECAGRDYEYFLTTHKFFDTKAHSTTQLLTNTKESNFSEDGITAMVNNTEFEYNMTNLKPSAVTITDSKGKRQRKEFTFPTDYPFITPYWTMTDQNIVNPIIEEKVFIDNDPLPLYVKKNNYSHFYPNGILLSKPSSLEVKNGTNAIETRMRFFDYDEGGNVTSLSKESDALISYIWDYSKKYPTAELVANASSNEFAFTSFEAQAKGNWEFNGTSYDYQDPPTGQKIYILDGSNSIVKNSLNPDRSYVVSYWTKNTNAFTIVGTQSNYPMLGKIVDGWIYYEHVISGQNQVVLNGTGLVDELRLYPLGGQLTSYTYNAVFGKTSQCDANNNITYFQYDEFGRLKLVRDQNKNVVQKICYNFSGQVEQCGNGTFQNNYTSGTFTKNDCPVGYLGSSVLYPVYPGDYTSPISQATADQLAQNAISNNGQVYANQNGTCILRYFNAQVQRVLSRNNCGSGFTTVPVAYIIPEARYRATTQAAANALAQADLDANAQNYANTYGICSPVGIYVLLSYENTYTTYSPYATYGDVVLRFYEDQQYTIPAYVSNLTINTSYTHESQNEYYTINSSHTVSGYSYILQSSTILNGNTINEGYVQNLWQVLSGIGYFNQ